jgi:hypothetical protein
MALWTPHHRAPVETPVYSENSTDRREWLLSSQAREPTHPIARPFRVPKGLRSLSFYLSNQISPR